MATPYLVALTIEYPSGTALANITVTGRIESTNESYSLDTNSSGEVVFNLGSATQFPSGYSIGDIFSYVVAYTGYEAYGSKTIDTLGGYTATVVLTAVPTAPSLRYFAPQEFLDFFNLKTYEDDAENGIKMQQLVKIGEMVEADIDEDCNTKFDNNSGSYYSQTDYLDDKADHRVFTPTKRPVQAITSLHYNTSRDGSADSWSTSSLTENTEYTLDPDTDQIRISDNSTTMPDSNRPRGWRFIYTYGRSSVPKDLKMVAIFDAAIRMGLATLIKAKLKGHDANAEDFMSWYSKYRMKVIEKYVYQTFINT